jgi:putative colanic acid biosynthesis acetyltransferase WcaF
MPLTTAPITIEEGAWVAADAFIGPGVTIGEGAVVGARSSVFKSLEAWTVAVGNPARAIKRRVLRANPSS